MFGSPRLWRAIARLYLVINVRFASSVFFFPLPYRTIEQYCVFGKLTAGWDVLTKMEEVETRREGIFVMPKERIDISSTYVYSVVDDKGSSAKSLAECEDRNKALQVELHEKRIKKLPSA